MTDPLASSSQMVNSLERDRVRAFMREQGVATAVLYIPPVHLQAVYRASPEMMAGTGLEMCDAGARIIGACCGSTPDHLAAMGAALAGR